MPGRHGLSIYTYLPEKKDRAAPESCFFGCSTEHQLQPALPQPLARARNL